MLNALSKGDQALANSHASQVWLVMIAAIGLTQVNLVFLIAHCLSALWIAAHDPSIKWRSVSKLAPYAVILPVIVYCAWCLHVSLHLSGSEFPLGIFPNGTLRLFQTSSPAWRQ